jgi:hypothetical protein
LRRRRRFAAPEAIISNAAKFLERAGWVGVFVLVAGLGACAVADNDSLSAFMVAPGKYDVYKCDQLAVVGKERSERAQELRLLMDKSAQGPGGAVANALAYRNEYLTAVGDLKQLENVALTKKCDMPWRPLSDRSMW